MKDAIGILGGTFNPIHNGHLKIAKAALLECGFSKILFMPNGNPPHKQNNVIISSFHRYNMVKLAIEGKDGFEVSDYEINRDKPSYTVDTNRALKKIYDCPLYFIIGADSLYTLKQWRNYEELIKECRFVVADRHCKEGNDAQMMCNKLSRAGANIKLLQMPEIDVTSTDIRLMIKQGADTSRFMPASVCDYIANNKLYL